MDPRFCLMGKEPVGHLKCHFQCLINRLRLLFQPRRTHYVKQNKICASHFWQRAESPFRSSSTVFTKAGVHMNVIEEASAKCFKIQKLNVWLIMPWLQDKGAHIKLLHLHHMKDPSHILFHSHQGSIILCSTKKKKIEKKRLHIKRDNGKCSKCVCLEKTFSTFWSYKLPHAHHYDS